MSKISLCFGSEQSTFEIAGLTAGKKNDLFSDDRRGRFSSVEVEDGKKDASPFRGDPKRPGIRYTTKEKTMIIRNNLNVPMFDSSLS
jgi:hypothetical protein